MTSCFQGTFEAFLQHNNAGNLKLKSCISGRTSWSGQFNMVCPQLFSHLTDVHWFIV